MKIEHRIEKDVDREELSDLFTSVYIEFNEYHYHDDRYLHISSDTYNHLKDIMGDLIYVGRTYESLFSFRIKLISSIETDTLIFTT